MGRKVRRLRLLRQEAGLSTEQLAHRAGLTLRFVWAVEVGKVANPGALSVARLRDALAAALGRPLTLDEVLEEAPNSGTAQS